MTKFHCSDDIYRLQKGVWYGPQRQDDHNRAYLIPDIIVKAIEDTYHETKAKVITTDGKTDEFDIYGGVLPGDTLAPYLFVIVLGYCLYSLRSAILEGKNILDLKSIPGGAAELDP